MPGPGLRIGAVTGQGGVFRIRLLNVKQVVRDMELEVEDVVDDMEDALPKIMKTDILVPANKICPKDTGALRRSGYVGVLRKGKWNIDASVGYTMEYAIYVHEILDAYHAPPTRAKWLEETYARNLAKVEKSLERELKRRAA
jgi:hypothetical protein